MLLIDEPVTGAAARLGTRELVVSLQEDTKFFDIVGYLEKALVVPEIPGSWYEKLGHTCIQHELAKLKHIWNRYHSERLLQVANS